MDDKGDASWIRVLGAVSAGPPGEESPFRSARQRALIARLVAAGGDVVSPSALIDAAWGDDLPGYPQGALQTQLSRLRAALGESLGLNVVHEPGGYRLAMNRTRVDAWHFEDLVAASRAQTTPGQRRALLESAHRLWRGDPYHDVIARCPLETHANFLSRLRRRAAADLAEACLDDGDVVTAIERLEALVAADPLDERSVGLLMRALHLTGEDRLALDRFQDHRRALGDELGLEPSPVIQAVEHDILQQALPPSGSQRRPPRRSPRPPVSRLVGRQHELDVAVDLITSAHIVTLVGPGGVGKTRLALHLCERVDEHLPGGVWWCDLASATSPEIERVVAESLGVQDRVGESLNDRIVAVLAGRRKLLVLDNCEHLGHQIAQLVDHLARRVPGLVIVVTSHQPLGINGEHQLRLRGLPTPTSSEASEATELFCERARAVDPGFDFHRDPASVAALARALGGIPLALELAASATSHASVDELATAVSERLDVLDRTTAHSDDRHRSLNAVIESSIARLDKQTSAMLHRLATFAGSFTQSLAEAFTPDGIDEPVATQLGSLVTASLILHLPGEQASRYAMLPPIRTVCLRRLRTRGDLDATQYRHSRIVTDAATRLDELLRSGHERSAHRHFEKLMPDLRATREWLLSQGAVDAVAQLCATTCWFTLLRTRSELTRWCEAAMTRLDPATPVFARLAASAAVGASKRGDLTEARALAENVARQHHDHARFGTEVLGQISLYEGRLEDAIALGARAAAAHRDQGNEAFAVNADTIGVAALAYLGRSEAAAAATSLIAAATAIEVPSLIAMAHYFAGEATSDTGEASRHYRRSIELAEDVGADFTAGLAATSLCAHEIRSGSSGPATARLPAVLDHWHRGGVGNQQWLVLRLIIEALSIEGDHAGVAVLTGALAGSAKAGPVYGDDARRLATAAEKARAGLGDQRFEERHAWGLLLDDDEAIREAVGRCETISHGRFQAR